MLFEGLFATRQQIQVKKGKIKYAYVWIGLEHFPHAQNKNSYGPVWEMYWLYPIIPG